MTAHSQRAHAKLSPSSAYRWFACPGSVKLSEGIENKSSVFADEGTAAHELAQVCLEHGNDAAQYLGLHVNINAKAERDKFTKEQRGKRSFPVTDEMVDAVQTYVDTVRGFIAEGDEYEFEAKLDLRHIPGMEFGTGDFLRYRPSTQEIVICDLKYGRGVPVDVKENEQLLTYAEGVAKWFHNRGLKTVTMVIVQPRCPHADGPVRQWSIDAVDLVDFRFSITERAEKVAHASRMRDAAGANGELYGPGASWFDLFLSPGEHCRFCPAAPTCPALRAFSLATAEMEFTDEPPAVSDMTPENLAEVLAKASVVEDWIARVKERAHQEALDGNPPTGFKMVHSTSHRKFKDHVDATLLATLLDMESDEFETEPKLKSPAQVEKLLGSKRKGEIAELVYKPLGKLILVPESDPREPAKVDAETEFAE